MTPNPIQELKSPKLKMAGWVYLPRFISKIRLHLAGRLPADYQPNFCKGFDGAWLKASRVNQDEFLALVGKAKDDAEIETWVRSHVRVNPAEIESFNQLILNRGKNDDASPKLKERKESSGFANRDDIQTFVDYIDADEGRL